MESTKEYAGKCVTLLSTASIQGYVFATNRLKENIGASELVRDATKFWDRGDNAEVAGAMKLFVGGGNAALLFDNRPAAERAVGEWSARALVEKPGLRLVAGHAEVSFGDRALAGAFRDAKKRLAACEERPPFGYPVGALPVVRSCPSTGRAAADREDGAWMSRESATKLRAVREANEALWGRYGKALGATFEMPLEFEDLGISEGASQIALIHADGDGIGAELNSILERDYDNGSLRNQLQKFSKAIEDLEQSAFAALIQDLSEVWNDLVQENLLQPRACKERFYLPLRPLIEAGDDVTFITAGKLGLSLATRYLHHFENKSKEAVKKYHATSNSLSACAGCLITPAKFPFARGYKLTEELIGRAKRARRDRGGKGCWLDFQILLEGSTGSIGQMRALHYALRENERLTARPYAYPGSPNEGWTVFESIWDGFKDDEKWPRSHAKRLTETLARGPSATQMLLSEYGSRGRSLPPHPEPAMAATGWYEGTENDEYCRPHSFRYTAYFDPLEFLDYHVGIDWEKRTIRKPKEAVRA